MSKKIHLENESIQTINLKHSDRVFESDQLVIN